MAPSRKEIAWALIVVGFLWLALFARWVPVPVRDLLFDAVLLLAIAMIASGWWRWRSVRQDGNAPSWRKNAGLLSLVANTVAIATPFIAFVYAFTTFNYRLPLPRLDWLLVVPWVLGLALCGLVAGLVAPSQVRLSAVLGGLIVAALIVAIPIGVL